MCVKLSTAAIAVPLMVAVLPVWIVVNHQVDLENSVEGRLARGLERVLRDPMSDQEIFFSDSSRYAGIDELGVAATVRVVVSGLGGSMAGLLRIPEHTDSSYVVSGSVIEAPWIVCELRTSHGTVTVERCSTDGLPVLAESVARLRLPIALASAFLAVALAWGWKRSRSVRVAGYAVAVSLLILLLVSGGVAHLVPSFPPHSRMLGDSIWSMQMLVH